jgi:hypothetical protein
MTLSRISRQREPLISDAHTQHAHGHITGIKDDGPKKEQGPKPLLGYASVALLATSRPNRVVILTSLAAARNACLSKLVTLTMMASCHVRLPLTWVMGSFP